jgi:NAD(P)-dependent dehydrogenase (short-subunit alcohol dehydrogenase family)
MDLRLAGRRALVTGSTAGIGWAIARELAAEGASVVVHGRDVMRMAQAVERLHREVPGADCDAVQADLSDAAGCAALIDATDDVDILVNNLGVYEPRAFERIDDAAWQRLFEINVLSGVRLARHHLPRMQRRGWGRVVFVSSESALCPPVEMIHYGMTKAAQLAVSRGLAETCAGTGVTVNAVLPGPTRTEGVQQFVAELAARTGRTPAEAEGEFFREARPTSLLKRFIEPREVATLVAYLCSPLSAATNGAALRVDGGVVRTIA